MLNLIEGVQWGEHLESMNLRSGGRVFWDLEIPEIVNMFMWRAGNDLLATKENLYRRKYSKDPLCPNCFSAIETILHVL